MIKLTPEKAPYYENVGLIKITKLILNQTGTTAPTITILEDPTKAEPIASYTTVGEYKITLNRLLTPEKTIVNLINNVLSGGIEIRQTIDTGEIKIRTYEATVQANAWLINTPLIIEEYP